MKEHQKKILNHNHLCLGQSLSENRHSILHLVIMLDRRIKVVHEIINVVSTDVITEIPLEGSKSDVVSAIIMIDHGHGTDGFRITNIVN